ncbi:NAD(P)-binding protein [Massarina eburnea CBS 473.64]|uniref:NAD(P)-binding protein n=1 Tax=Massarina eburnea CBS 473.64 TaxID=1395130 RepID=A0A6A6RM71_9PLEO|nr:NAD(P)-binding protein [Massarina eburnea CBS 473.64]
MQTVPAAVPNFIRDPKASVQYVEDIALGRPKETAKTNDEVKKEENARREFRDIETTALVVKEPKGDFELQKVILDEVREDEVLVEMKYSGICHTDIVLQQGLLPMVDFPAIFGHEGAGYIRALGSSVTNKSLKIGDPVLLSFNTCGTCKPCKTSHPAFCTTHAAVNHNAVRISDRSTPARLPDGTSVRSQYFGHSSFAKMSVVNEKCVVKCAGMSEDMMAMYAPIGCGFQTGAGTVLNVLKPGREDSIVVFGLGSVGLTALMAAKYIDAGTIIAVDIVQGKLDMGKELGATHLVNSRETKDIVQYIKEMTNGGAAYAIDCTGLLSVIEDMIECLAPLGTAALVGVPPSGKKIQIDPLTFLLDNKKLIGVIEGDSNPVEFIPKLVEMQMKGDFPIEKLCRTYPVERLKDAIQDLHTGKVIKPVLQWS